MTLYVAGKIGGCFGLKGYVKIYPTSGEPERMASLRDVFFSDSLKGFIVGAGGTVLFTSNGGRTWEQQSSGTTASIWMCVVRGAPPGAFVTVPSRMPINVGSPFPRTRVMPTSRTSLIKRASS